MNPLAKATAPSSGVDLAVMERPLFSARLKPLQLGGLIAHLTMKRLGLECIQKVDAETNYGLVRVLDDSDSVAGGQNGSRDSSAL